MAGKPKYPIKAAKALLIWDDDMSHTEKLGFINQILQRCGITLHILNDSKTKTAFLKGS